MVAFGTGGTVGGECMGTMVLQRAMLLQPCPLDVV